MISLTGVSAGKPSATARTAISRSVIMPTSRSFSATGSAPASSSAINCAASRIVCSGLATRTSLVIACFTFIALPPVQEPAGHATRNAGARRNPSSRRLPSHSWWDNARSGAFAFGSRRRYGADGPCVIQCASRIKKNPMSSVATPIAARPAAHCQERLNALPREVLQGLRRGIEKESLRVRPDGTLATTPHPMRLGSALKHPHITTDFSESQLELITGVHTGAEACLKELTEIHQVVYRAIGDELLWCASMPCRLPADDAIPIGRYGSSNVGRAKTVYRTGLSHRYGRRMQTISGIHYNFSLPDARSNDDYFALIRNFRRHSWLLLYLFGASPAVCSSFVAGREHELERLSDDTLYLPYATSLRMGRLGYQSDAQASLAVSYNDLGSYAASLEEALTKPYPAYEAFGIR